MTGIRKTPKGWQAFIRIDGEFRSKRFPPQTSLTDMKRWREEQRVRARIGATLPPQQSTFAEDVRHYLEQIATMPTIRWRRDDLALWLAVFGAQRDRRTITAGDIRAQLERWRADDYAASTVNHRRTALMHLWTILDGRTAPNPARDVARYRAEDRGPRGLPPRTILAILEHMRPSQTKARLEVMAWTGWPQMTLERLAPADIHWNRAVYVKRRRKGKGVIGEWLELLPPAWTALRAFKRLGCWGTFSRDSMRKSWQLAARHTREDKAVPKALKATIHDDTHPYDLRHSFGTLVALVTRDDTAVQRLMRHSDPRQTAHYMRAAGDPRTAAALWEVAKQLPRLSKQANYLRKTS